MNIYNTLTNTKEEFKTINPGKVGMYICGPTVYDHCHLGHARGYVSMDIIRRYLEFQGLEVREIMNYTDVGHLVHDGEIGEDKIEQKAKKEKLDPMAIVEKYIQSTEEDFKALNIKPAAFNPRPTEYIAQIIKFVEKLIEKEFAYGLMAQFISLLKNFQNMENFLDEKLKTSSVVLALKLILRKKIHSILPFGSMHLRNIF